LTFDIFSDGAAILEMPPDDFAEWMKRGFELRQHNFGTDLLCYSPTAYPYEIDEHKQSSSYNFNSLSVTGTSCSLNCEHCQGRLLKGMQPTLTPDTLINRCMDIKLRGGAGVLISGGSDSEGHVPLARFGEALRIIKGELGLQVVVHTGLVSEETAQMLAKANIDAAMLDVIGDEQVSEKVYHIPDGPKKMEQSLQLLHENGIHAVPHVLVGLDYGRLSGELQALEIISRTHPAAVVIIALSPIRKTPMEHVNPPSPETIGKVITVARLGMAKIPVLLGCARPIGAHKIESDRYAILSGANGIAYISQEGVVFAREMGLRPVFQDICCSLAFLTVQKPISD
jgi:uncharacterized radical SAM superfamily protein